MPGRLAVSGGVVGEPLVEVGLPAGLQSEVVGRQPLQEGDARVGALTCGHELLRGKRAAIVASARPPDQMPDRVPVQDLALFGVLLGCEETGEEAFEADHVLIVLGQGTDVDEHLAEVSEGRAVGQLVEGLVGRARRPAARSDRTGETDDLFSHRLAVMGCSVVAMLCRRASRPGWRASAGGPSSSLRRRLIRQRAHWPGCG